jgi:hypothetical protein
MRLFTIGVLALLLLGPACSRKGAGDGESVPPTAVDDAAPELRLDAGDPPRTDGANPRAVRVGMNHACAVMTDDSLRCWGQNDWGQLGVVVASIEELAGVKTPDGLDDAVEVATGYGTTCVRHRGGGVSCWGANHLGQSGTGAGDPVERPTRVAGLDDAVALAAGTNHACAVLADATARCWGENTYQALGDGAGGQKSAPVTPKGLPPVRAIAAETFTCALGVDAGLWCWGMNHEPTPGRLGDGAGAVSLGGLSGCFLRDGQVWCWGWNGEGQLGGEATDEHGAPRRVPGIEGAVDVAVGARWACAVDGEGAVRCWGARAGNATGFEAAGCLRDNSPSGGGGAPAITRYCPEPVAVPGLPPVAELDAGHHQTCALTRSEPAEVWCWGEAPPARVL